MLHNITALNIASEEASRADLKPSCMKNDLASDSSSHYGDGEYGRVRFDSRFMPIKELDPAVIEKRDNELQKTLCRDAWRKNVLIFPKKHYC